MSRTINRELCEKCRLCMEICPCHVIGINHKEEVHFIQEKEVICLNCGQCMAICSTKAISVNGLSYEENVVDLPENKVGYDAFMGFLANRRSIRNYRNKAVPDDVLLKIVDSISLAPYGAAPEKVNISIINNREKIEAALPFISKFLDDITVWMENPVASFIIRTKNRQETFNTLKNHLYPISKSGNYKLELGDRITRGAPALILFHAEKGAEEHTNNAIIYATYMNLAAHSLGLGATMIGIIPAAINKVPEVRQIFQIPKEHEATASMILGYPKYRYKRAIKRKPQPLRWIH